MSNLDSLSRVRECVVVGAGIAGCATAYELARRGVRVTVFERSWIGAAASGLNMGLLLNQVEPGVVRIMHSSLRVYQQLSQGGLPFDLRQRDQLLLAMDPEQLEIAEERALAMRDIGLEVQPAETAALRSEMPQLSPDVAGGWIVRGAWVVDPAGATRAFAEAAREAGAEIRTGVRVGGVVTRSGKLDGLVTDAGRVAADAVVLASGPWLSELWPAAPVSAGRGWLMRTGRLPAPVPWIIEEMSWPDQEVLGRSARVPTLSRLAAGGYDRPVASAFAFCSMPAGDALLGTSLAPSLRDAVEGLDMPELLARRALAAAPGLGDLEVLAAWWGMRPMTPDGMPIAGGTGVEGVYLHGGHASIGMMAAPAMAGWLAEQIVSGKPAPELRELSPERFEGRETQPRG